jgi:hypothetical protein
MIPDTYFAAVHRYRKRHPSQRLGQAMVNVLSAVGFEFAMVGTDYDPFYQDARIPLFLEELSKHMSSHFGMGDDLLTDYDAWREKFRKV